MKGRTIRLYLVDGVPNSILTAEIINWTGKVIVAPRSQLSDLAKRDEVRRTGLYCLVGPDPEQSNRDRVYIGEGDSVLTRLSRHDKDERMDFWTRTAVVISKDDNITKSHGRYLESRLIDLAVKAGRASVENDKTPVPPPLPEPDVADMEYFLEQTQMIFPVLAMTFLQPKPAYDQSSISDPDGTTRFVMKEGDKQAFAVEVGGEFVVLAGSPARKEAYKNWKGYRGQRDALVDAGKLVDSDDPEHFVFAENVGFASPSAAANVVAAGSRNGREYWKVEGTGQTYGQWQDAKLAEVEGEDGEAED